MFCGKCGKEIPEGQTICEDCSNKIQTNSNEKNKYIIKKPVKIALISILAIILLSVIITINMSNLTLKKANISKEDIETNNSTENKENEQQIKKSYIAENGQEFNINALELVKKMCLLKI